MKQTLYQENRHKLRASDIVIYVILALYTVFNITMFLLLLSGSLKSQTEIFSKSIWALPTEPIWGNYVKAWNVGKIGNYTFNSFYVSFISVLLTGFLASMAAYVLGCIEFKFRNFIISVFMICMMLPPFVIAIPLSDVLSRIGLINSLYGLIIVYVAKQLPFSIFILTSFYRGLPSELEEAAEIDGASAFQAFIQIMLPLTGPALLSVSINNLINYWNEFLYALIFMTDKEAYTLPVGLFHLSQAAEYSSSWPMLFAGMIISSMPMIIIFIVFQEQFISGVSQGAIKG